MKSLQALLLVMALPFALPALAADAAFDANLALARQNLATVPGAAYDRALGEAIMQLPAVAEAMGACQHKHPEDQKLQGYFHFTSRTDYTVVLAPAGPFASCLGKALEGQALPAPPSLPWFNHFTFSYTAPAAGSAP